MNGAAQQSSHHINTLERENMARSKTKGRQSIGKRQKTNDEDIEEEPAAESLYKPGSISRVKLHNFLTYNEVEFFPGPR